MTFVISSKSFHLRCCSRQYLTLHSGKFPLCRMLCIYIYICSYLWVDDCSFIIFFWTSTRILFTDLKYQVPFTRGQSYLIYSFIISLFNIVIIFIPSLYCPHHGRVARVQILKSMGTARYNISRHKKIRAKLLENSVG